MALEDKYQQFRRDLDEIDKLIDLLKREYDMFFAGMLKRQPQDLKNKIEALIRRHRAKQVHKLEMQFRFQSVQSKFIKQMELVDKIFKRRELDPNARSAYGPSREQLAAEATAIRQERETLVRGDSAPERPAPSAVEKPGDQMRGLFDQYVDAKKELGESVGNLKYDKFRNQLEQQLTNIKSKTGAKDVEFQVTRKNGKVSLTAKPVRK